MGGMLSAMRRMHRLRAAKIAVEEMPLPSHHRGMAGRSLRQPSSPVLLESPAPREWRCTHKHAPRPASHREIGDTDPTDCRSKRGVTLTGYSGSAESWRVASKKRGGGICD